MKLKILQDTVYKNYSQNVTTSKTGFNKEGRCALVDVSEDTLEVRTSSPSKVRKPY